MRIITISGKAQHGKDTFANMIKNATTGQRVAILHFADYLKLLAKTAYGWNGIKDDAGRTLLQHLGTDIIRERMPDFWVVIMSTTIFALDNEFDVVILPDTRFKNEVWGMRELPFSCLSISIVRPNFDNGLTEEQKNHRSENDLNDYKFDCIIENNGSLEDLKYKALELVHKIYE